jgi:hypothetical protein
MLDAGKHHHDKRVHLPEVRKEVSTMKMPTPIPCPWCGKVPSIIDSAYGRKAVECMNRKCPVNPGTTSFTHDNRPRTLRAAILAWNKAGN